MIERKPIAGEKIRKIRLEMNYSMQNFCKKFDLNIPLFSQFEFGCTPPTEEMLVKICNALNLDIVEIKKLNDDSVYIPFNAKEELKGCITNARLMKK